MMNALSDGMMIGVMKAIGLRVCDIKKIYLASIL
jgi:hypothetical protein